MSLARMGGAAAPQQLQAQSSLWDWMSCEQHRMAQESAAVAKTTAPMQVSAAPAVLDQALVRAQLSAVETTIA